MSTTVDRAELLRLITAVSKVVDSKNTIPLLSHVVMRGDGAALALRGTDLDIEVSGSVAAEGELAAVAVPARELADIVRRLAGQDVNLELDGDRLIVKSGRSRFKLPTLDPASYPTIADAEYTASFEADLAALLSKVTFAAGPHTHRPMLVGTYLHAADGVLAAVATDGKRMAFNRGGAVDGDVAAILPPKLIPNVPQGTVQVDVGPERVRLTAAAAGNGALQITSKLITGPYPDYQRIWPEDQDITVVLDRAALRDAVNRVSAVSDENSGKGVRLGLANNTLTLQVTSHARGEATEELAIDYDGEPYSTGFNCTMLHEILGQVPGREVVLRLGGKVGADIRGEGEWAGIQMYFAMGE